MTEERFACPCCGYRTFIERPGATFDICQVCYWEDDPYQFQDPDSTFGANPISLREARKNFEAFGACEREMIINVRAPRADEQREEGWKAPI